MVLDQDGHAEDFSSIFMLTNYFFVFQYQLALNLLKHRLKCVLPGVKIGLYLNLNYL